MHKNVDFNKISNSLVVLIVLIIIYMNQMDKVFKLVTLSKLLLILIITFSIIVNANFNKIKLYKKDTIWIGSILLLSVSSLVSINKNASLKYALDYFIAIYVFFYFSKNSRCIETLVKNIKRITLILCIFTVLPLINFKIYYEVISIFFNQEMVEKMTIFINHNRLPGLGGFLGNNAFLLSIGLGVYFESILSNKKLRLMTILNLIFVFLCILLTGSRTNLLICIFSMILCLYIKDKNTLLSIVKKTSKVFVVSIITLAFIMYIYPEVVVNIIDRFINGGESINTRFILYNYAIELFMDKPILGHGINTFLGLTFTNPSMIEHTYTHNVILQLMAETGIVGMLIIIIPYALIWIRTISALRKKTYNKHIYSSLYIQNIFLLYFIAGNSIYDFNMLISYFVFASVILSTKNAIKMEDR